jgi:hypothetical protein
MQSSRDWLPLDVAAKKYGYADKTSFFRRLKQLRERGYVVDVGRPPDTYPIGDEHTQHKTVILWPNPKVSLVRSDAPAKLFNPKRGKRARAKINGLSR